MEEVSILEKIFNGINHILWYAVPLSVYLGVPAVITGIVNMLLKKNVKRRMVRIIVNCFVFITFLTVMIAPGCYVVKRPSNKEMVSVQRASQDK